MAITRAQQVKQMLQNGGRIGYVRGGRKGNTGQTSQVSSEFNNPSANRVAAATNIKSMQQALGSGIGPKTKEQQEARDRLRDQRERTIDTIKENAREARNEKIAETFGSLLPTRRNLFNRSLLIPGARKNITKQRKAYADYLRSMGVVPSEELEDTDDLFRFFEKKAFDKSSPDYEPNPGDVGTFNPEIGRVGTKEDAILNYGDFLLKEFGNPTVKYSGDIAKYNREMGFERGDNAPVQMANKIITDPTDPTDPNQTTDVFAGISPRFAGSIFDFDKLRREQEEEEQFAADGGRIGLQEGGGIEQRLEQLGGDVTSAEQMLQGINQRLKTAESSLGSGATGGPQVTAEDLKKIASDKIGGLTVTNLGQLPTEPAGLGIFAGNISPPTMTGLANVSLPEKLIPIDPYKNTMLSGLSQDGQRFDSAQSAFDALAEQTRKAREVNPFTRDVIGTERFQGAEGFKSFTDMFNKINDPGFVAPSLQLASQGSLGIPAAGYADGGRIGVAEGGIMDLETGRQMYFLGKLVKKAKRAVKKIAKSPIGKAAILGGALYFGKNPGTLSSFFGKGSFSPFKALLDAGTADAGFGPSGLGRLLGEKFINQSTGALTLGSKIGLGTLALPFLTGDEEEEQDMNMGPELTMEQLRAIRNSPYRYTAPRFEGSQYKFAEGGEAKEPVASKTMPLLDMGGKEMDLRDDGGFVPIGRMEKADDVPARLSKNEFVFTADAVRNAGEGDVDKGAEVMYNMMKNLESGGEVSEESQGLQGARDMFQTSKRLEEVL
jgi:hypothetical protein